MILAIYFALAACAWLEATFPSALWPVAAMVAYIGCMRMLFRRYPAQMLLMSVMTLTKALIVFSIVFIGLGFWIVELQMYATGPVYAFYFCILAVLFTHAACITITLLGKSRFLAVSRRPRLGMDGAQALGVAAVSGVVIVFLLITGMTKGFATLDGVDRFAYRADGGWLFGVVMTSKPLLTACLGLARFRLRPRIAMALILELEMVALVGLFALFGDKFLSLIVVCLFFALPSLLFGRRGRVQIPPQVLAFAGLLLPTVLGLTYWVYSGFGAYGWDTTIERIFGRATGQGQVWYITMNSMPDLFSIDHFGVTRLIGAMGVGGEPDPLTHMVGIFYIISRFAPRNVYNNIVTGEGLVQFTGGFEAYIMLLFGQVPMVIAVIAAGILAGLLSYYFWAAIRDRSALSVAVAVYGYMAVYAMINQAALWLAIGAKAMIYLAAFIFIERCVNFLILEPASAEQVRA